MNPLLIDVTPDPPVAGGTITICYDFSNQSFSSALLKIIWTPSGSDSITVTEESPCVEYYPVPGSATTLTIEDHTGPSADWGGVVAEP